MSLQDSLYNYYFIKNDDIFGVLEEDVVPNEPLGPLYSIIPPKPVTRVNNGH